MAATVTLADTIAWAQPFLNWANLAIGTNNEPAMSAANLVLQTIEGPPFVWPWNRAKTTFQTIADTQDYAVNVANYGFLETASIQMVANITSVTGNGTTAIFQASNNFSNGQALDIIFPCNVYIQGCTTSSLNGWQTMTAATSTTFTINFTTVVTETESGATALAGKIMPLELKWGALSEATELGRPQFISTQLSNESGTAFTFRLLPVPDTTYQVNLNYQMSPTLFTGTGQLWDIPDQLEYIQLFLPVPDVRLFRRSACGSLSPTGGRRFAQPSRWARGDGSKPVPWKLVATNGSRD